MWNARLDESQTGIKIARRNINNLRYADDTILMAEIEEEVKGLLMKVKEKSDKAGLNSTLKKTKIVASSSITPWQRDGEKVETMIDFIVLASKITVDSDCSHEIKRCLLLGRKAMTNPDSILSRDSTLSTKVHLVKAMVFPVIMYRCESWTVKKAEHWRWCFHTVVLEKTLESSLDCKEIKSVNPKGNQPWIVIGRTDAKAEAPILWPHDAKSWKDPDAGKDWRQGRSGQWRMRWLDGIIDSMETNLG